jgi:maleamate amidohydrolase
MKEVNRMNRFSESNEMYKNQGFANRVGYGEKPAVIVIDYVNAFTDSSYKLGGNYDQQIDQLIPLLDEARKNQVPVIYTTTAYHPSMEDGGMFAKKVPSLNELILGTPAVEVDDRITPHPQDHLIVKKFASAFFGTNLSSLLTQLKVDTLIVTGCTTSGCVRASVIDANQYGYRAIIPKECVGDRNQFLHENNLFDMDVKYGDVTSVEEVIPYLKKVMVSL